MTAPQAPLLDFRPRHPFFVGVDSDGCVFDTMELKHKECFIPEIIRHYELQAVSKYAREVAEFANLYSRWRGTNRFPGLVLVLDLLRERPEVRRRGVEVDAVDALRAFVASGKTLGNPALAEAAGATGDPVLERALAWSHAVNDAIAATVRGVGPFPGVRETLTEIDAFADIVCVSATPMAALRAEWEEHDIDRFARAIAGQELGSKEEILRAAAVAGYEGEKTLMVGDAPGDLRAAQASGALFFPIVPGEEEESWRRLAAEGLERFRSGRYAGDYQARLVDEFLARLPTDPPWKT